MKNLKEEEVSAGPANHIGDPSDQNNIATVTPPLAGGVPEKSKKRKKPLKAILRRNFPNI